MIEQWLPYSYNRCLIRLRRYQNIRQCAAWHPLSRLDMFAPAVVTAAWNVARISSINLGQAVWTCSFRCPQRRISISVRFGEWGAIQSVLDVESTSQCTSRSTTTGCFPKSVLELRRAETRTSASQQEAQLQAAPVEQFPRNRDTIQHPAYQVTHENISDDSSPNSDLMPKFAGSMRIIPCPEVIIVAWALSRAQRLSL
jgi:hypothetical protein